MPMRYRNLVGLEASHGRWEGVESKKLYSELHKLQLNENTPLPEARVDAITAAGILTHGHVPPYSLGGFPRLEKRGAAIIFSVYEVAAHAGGFMEKMRWLEHQGT